MEQLKQRIRREGKILGSDILKVSSFLNHRIDIIFLDEMAAELCRRFEGQRIDKVLTIEASGIAIACAVARILKVPVVFCKKSASATVSDDVYSVKIHSFTHNNENNVIVSKDFISKGENILVVDDFLANGCALEGLFSLIEQGGAVAVGAGIVIEKGYQKGGDKLRENGRRIESLAIIDSMSEKDGIKFRT